MNEDSDERNRHSPENPKPDIDITPQIKAEGLNGSRKKFLNLFGEKKGHAGFMRWSWRGHSLSRYHTYHT